MRKRTSKSLSLTRETLHALTHDEILQVAGANATVASACKDAACGTGDPELCAVSWASNCFTYTC